MTMDNFVFTFLYYNVDILTDQRHFKKKKNTRRSEIL